MKWTDLCQLHNNIYLKIANCHHKLLVISDQVRMSVSNVTRVCFIAYKFNFSFLFISFIVLQLSSLTLCCTTQ